MRTKSEFRQSFEVVPHIFSTAHSSKWLMELRPLSYFANSLRLAWRLIVNVKRDFTVDRFAVAECGNEFCVIEIG